MNAAAAMQPITQSSIQMNERKFFHYAPNYDKFYLITCHLILQGSDSFDDYNYDHGFFYNIINPTANYYVTCKIFSHSLIVNILNKKIHGLDIDTNNAERKELLTLNQKLDLEQDLKQILPFHLTQNHIPNRDMTDRNLNSSYGYNTQTISITDSQTSFDNNFSQQTGVGYYTNDVTNSRQQVNFNNIPQHIPKISGCSGNTNSFGGNIGNNVMTMQANLITDSQNNGFAFSSSTSAAPQNSAYHITNSPQPNDFNNIIIPQQITDREMRLNPYRNTSSFHGNIVNNTFTMQSASTTDINRQDVNRTRDSTYIQKQVDINDNYGDTDSHNRNIGNNVMTTQANGLTYDHPDINDIHHQVTQQQQQVDANNNYRDTDSHNRNTGNNVTTTQANGLTYDHPDLNDIHPQVTQPQQVDINNNYGNTGNNVATTQANDMICDHQYINDINQVTQQ
ncbi:hypothetical protein GLOIN_2v1786931 [Rhizophagus irregularis DAOM 181602=DAOM 197198]|nr:hypothetical protein GLOIN_2v1786931 [Rhizophagus irregularis DAOM 181602=DAOM 197198]POG61159.1 hypothetical protein GLOIN_2v1786931 [Rhizophagus irregularis DAOM 181602=DAOM 197198]|eukprot:XP_025168025.1 hypothetical protein GLOIN_2v1786931 [Rhizophagus irregularis DAOM 181602=DAOM 197198]